MRASIKVIKDQLDLSLCFGREPLSITHSE